jgi:protein farnesyltransferase/geranylgeranyltransferase type-1 subunit alpha
MISNNSHRIYRAKILFALGKDLNNELEWLNDVSLKYLKNYQIWYVQSTQRPRSQTNQNRHHRQVLLSSREHFPTMPPKEADFLMEMFAQDSKNYHVWTYRHWLVRHFRQWDEPRELQDVEALLKADVRNNSAWNHRYMLRFGPRDTNRPDAGMMNAGDMTTAPEEKGRLPVVDEDLVDGELKFAQEAILRAPENRSAWWYARGVLRAAGRGLGEWEDFAGSFVSDGGVKSTHALEWLADVYAVGREGLAVGMLTRLKEEFDPIRANYWDYRIKKLGVAETEVAVR